MPSEIELFQDMAADVLSDNWSTHEDGTLFVGEMVFEIMGDPQRIDDALILACAVTGSRH